MGVIIVMIVGVGKIKTFIYTLKRTFTSPAYYADILRAPFSFSFQYFGMFFLIYALVGTAFFGVKSVPGISRFLSILPKQIVEIYPSDLEINIKNGNVSTNQVEPYAIPLGNVEKAFSDQVLGTSTEPKIENLVVIDTSGSSENFADYKTLLLVTKRNVVTYDKNNTLKLYNIDSTMNMTINKTLILQLVGQITPYLKYVAPLIIGVGLVSLLVFVPLYYLAYALFFALLLWAFAKMMKCKLTYSKSYQLGLHMCTLTAALFGIMSLMGLNLSIPFLQTIVLLVFSYFVLAAINKAQVLNTVPKPPGMS